MIPDLPLESAVDWEGNTSQTVNVNFNFLTNFSVIFI